MTTEGQELVLPPPLVRQLLHPMTEFLPGSLASGGVDDGKHPNGLVLGVPKRGVTCVRPDRGPIRAHVPFLQGIAPAIGS